MQPAFGDATSPETQAEIDELGLLLALELGRAPIVAVDGVQADWGELELVASDN